jgi:hypothetical protein
MKKYLKEYSEQNKEKFNEDLFHLREKEDILEQITDVLKTAEVLEEIKIDWVKLETDESQHGPIIFQTGKNQEEYFKPTLSSRLDKVSFQYTIIAEDKTTGEKREIKRTKFIYLNKLINNWFYQNEGARYYLIYQIVDNATYSTGSNISLKSLLMPITLQKKPEAGIEIVSEGTNNTYSVPIYQLMLFAKNVNILLYYLARSSFNRLQKLETTPENIISVRDTDRYPQIIDEINEFFSTNIKFSDKIEDLMQDGWEVFKTPGDEGVYLAVEKEKLEKKDPNLLAILGCFFEIRLSGKQKKKHVFTYDNLISPMFWINTLASYFTLNTDSIRKFEKIRTMLTSLDRLTDNSTRKILKIADEDKKDTFTILRWMLLNFETLRSKDPNDFNTKRIRIAESMLFPLRDYISKQIYRILNAPTRSLNVLEKLFSNIQPTFLLKTTIVSELLRFYNPTNEFNFFTILRSTLTGPQSLTKTVSDITRDVQPSQVGRLSLISSSASNPGLSSVLTPFCELEPGMYFVPDED